MRSQATFLIKSFLCLSLFIHSFCSAYACDPPLGAKPASLTQKALDSSYVFDGVVTKITATDITIKVKQYFIGSGGSQVKIAQNQAQITSCSDQYELDQRAIFFTQGNINGLLEAVYDGAFGSMRLMNADNFSEITAATKCMASYVNGRLIVPCVAYKNTQTVYQVILEPKNSPDNLEFSLNYVSPVSKIQHITNFDQGQPGSLPDNWTMGITGIGISDWKLEKDNTAPSPSLVLKQSGEGDFPWSINNASNLSDGFVAVKFKAISGNIDQAAGLIWRWKDAHNYYVARANALEDNVSIYYMKNGQRYTLRYQDVPNDLPVERDVWQTLRVDFQGNHFRVSYAGKKIIDIFDDHIRGSGAVGLWTKEDSVTAFDDFSYGE